MYTICIPVLMYDESLTLINLLLFILWYIQWVCSHRMCADTWSQESRLMMSNIFKLKYFRFPYKLTDDDNDNKTYQINFNFNTLLITDHKSYFNIASNLQVFSNMFAVSRCCCCYITIAMFSRYFISPKQMVHTITSVRVREVGFHSAVCAVVLIRHIEMYMLYYR